MSPSINYFPKITLFFQKLSNKYLIASNVNTIAWIMIIFGVILRLSQYLYNRSFWPDESPLALNLVQKSFLDFLKPLDYHQAAPFGFSIIAKSAIQTFGNTDLVLRLFPFFAGILSLLLFYRVAKYNLNNKAMLISLGLFSLSDPLIYYSSELKQYSSDVMVMLLLLIVAYLVLEKKSSAYFTLLGFAGAVLIWFSHPAMFVLAGIGLSLGLYYLLKKDKSSFIKLLFVFVFWFFSFSVLFILSLKYLANDSYMVGFWEKSFLPRNPFSSKINFIEWYLTRPFAIFQHPVGLYFTGLGVLTFIIGAIEFYKYKRIKLAILIFPLLVTLTASAFQKYPFNHRLILFLVPVFLVIIGNGVGELFNRKYVYSNMFGIIVVILLFIHPLVNDLRYLVNPRTRDEIKPVMQYLAQNRKPGDTIYLYNLADTGFKYYGPKYGLTEKDYIVGDYFHGEWKDAEKFIGAKRFWIFFTHISPSHPHAKEIYLSFLRNHGKELTSFSADNASVYLFDLSRVNN